jgi:hypothetical protein
MGFTIHAMWPNGGTDPSSMLVDYSRQLVAFRNQCNRTLVYPPSTPCYLSVSRGTDIDKMRTIGWREGLGSKSIPVQGASAGLVQSAAKGSRDYQEGRYNFIIERESPDAKYLHARFSFEIEFASGNKYYSVFFEGCCRPDTLRNNAVSDTADSTSICLPVILTSFVSTICKRSCANLWCVLAGPRISRAHGGLRELKRKSRLPDVIFQVCNATGNTSQA